MFIRFNVLSTSNILSFLILVHQRLRSHTLAYPGSWRSIMELLAPRVLQKSKQLSKPPNASAPARRPVRPVVTGAATATAFACALLDGVGQLARTTSTIVQAKTAAMGAAKILSAALNVHALLDGRVLIARSQRSPQQPIPRLQLQLRRRWRRASAVTAATETTARAATPAKAAAPATADPAQSRPPHPRSPQLPLLAPQLPTPQLPPTPTPQLPPPPQLLPPAPTRLPEKLLAKHLQINTGRPTLRVLELMPTPPIVLDWGRIQRNATPSQQTHAEQSVSGQT